MMKRQFAVLALVGAIWLGGCTFTSHEIELMATPPSAARVNIGEGVGLQIVVIDDRDQRVIGQRGVGSIGSDISSPQLVDYIQRQVVQGFQSRGFVLVSDNQPHDMSATVFLRSFKWHTQMGFWTGGENVHVSIKADATNSKTKESLVKTYQYDHEKRVLFVSFGEEITRRMNAGLSDVLAQLFSDDELMRFLTGVTGAEG